MASKQSPPHLQVENLESRELPASHLTASLPANVLRINGTDNDDQIIVRQFGASIAIDRVMIETAHGHQASVSLDQIDKIEVRGLNGNDLIVFEQENGRPADLDIPVVVWAGLGDDEIRGTQGNDQIFGQVGDDVIHGFGGDDEIHGDEGDDVIWGGIGDDTIHGGAGDNRLFGGDGADLFFSQTQGERVDGGQGRDQAMLNYSPSFRGRTNVYNVEKITADGTTTNVEQPPLAVHTTPRTTVAEVQKSEPTREYARQAQKILILLNQYRNSRGLDSLTLNDQLIEAAQYQADEIARTNHYSHVNLDGRGLVDRVDAAGYQYWWIAENAHKYDPDIRRSYGVDRVYSKAELPEYFMEGWKASSSHNRSMLSSRAAEVGIALARSSTGDIYAVQVFGDPRP